MDTMVRQRNALLAALGPGERARWCDLLEPVHMPTGQVLCASGSMVEHVYFPTTSVVSLQYLLHSGACIQVAVVGREGLVGLPLFMGGINAPSRAVVQIAGEGYRLRAEPMSREFGRSPAVQALVLRYAQALINQMAQLAVCNRHHCVYQQLCRWLLLTLDRLAANEIPVTHQMIAETMGVRRESVTQAALRLQREGLLRCRRGHITVLDRGTLEEKSCECYSVVKTEDERLLPPVCTADCGTLPAAAGNFALAADRALVAA